MSRFKPGETSKKVLDKKNEITSSLLKKSELINQIESYADIPEGLTLKGNFISQAAAHKWHDYKLGIIANSRNSAHALHNSHALNSLLESINNANQKLQRQKFSKMSNTIESHKLFCRDSESKLRNENNELKLALAEVYRAYMHLVDQHREDRQIDEAYRNLVLTQARILGRHRIREVK